MKAPAMPPTFFIGWDVGGWNCDTNNNKSRDAIVILHKTVGIVGKPWRGNLRESINTSAASRDWMASLFRMCQTEAVNAAPITLAIDTPLGFSAEFLALVGGLNAIGPIGDSPSNPYLYRQTERRLFKAKKRTIVGD